MGQVSRLESGVLCVLIFALLFAIVLVNTTSTDAKHETANNLVSKLAAEVYRCTLHLTTTSSNDMCDITCWTTANLTDDVDSAIFDDDICSSIGYHLRWYEPQVSKLGPGWFKASAIINKISIQYDLDDEKITEIEPGAFNDCTFRKMTELVISRTKITQLKRGVFEGASSLKKLTLDENVYLKDIEENTLNPLHQLEEMTMTQQRQVKSLLNFTGTTQLKQLRTLTLSLNNFSSSIDAETFKGCTSVEILNLFNSFIQAIGIGSFDHMAETIRFIDLSNNQLKQLPTNLLANLMRPNVQIYVALANNMWHCDCDSFELQSWSINRTHLTFDSPLVCDTPLLENGKVITDVDLSLCDLNLHSTITPDATRSTDDYATRPETSTPQVPFLERLNCVNEKYGSGHLYLEKGYQNISIKQVAMGKVSVRMNFTDATLSMVVINDKDEANCRYDLNREMTFDNLDTKSAHLFCLIPKTFSATSPKNCYPFQFDDTLSIWGHDEIIIVLVCSIVLSLVVGLLCGWLLSCRYHRVLKAKESLQYQSSARSTTKTETSTIPSGYDAGNYDLDGGPSTNRLRRTYSDNSIVSCKSYMTAVTPSPFEIIQWKLRKNTMKSYDFQPRDYLDRLEYDCLPPPLPPNQNRRNSEQIYETINEPVYTCTSEIVPYRITYANQR